MPIQVTLEDHTGSSTRQVRLDENTEIERLIPALISTLKLPITDNAGRPITYLLSYNGRRLVEGETLASANVVTGDNISIVPEMMAGGPPLALDAVRSFAEKLSPLAIELDDLLIRARSDSVPVYLHITEEPLTVHNLAIILSSFTELYTKCWLIKQGRYADLIDYAQTQDIRYVKAANLRIGMLSHNSPAFIEILTNPVNIAGLTSITVALKIAIDTLVQTPLRYKSKKLENQKKELEIKIREQEAQHVQQVATETAELERQKTLLEIARQQLEIKEQLLEMHEKAFQAEKKQIVRETADKLIDTLQPNMDIATKEILVQPLLPSLFQLSNIEGLEMIRDQ